MTEFVEVYWPFVAWFIIGFMCGAAVENWARRSHIAQHGEIDDICDDH